MVKRSSVKREATVLHELFSIVFREGSSTVDIVGQETNTNKREILDTSFRAVNDKCISQPSKCIHRIWIWNLQEYVCVVVGRVSYGWTQGGWVFKQGIVYL